MIEIYFVHISVCVKNILVLFKDKITSILLTDPMSFNAPSANFPHFAISLFTILIGIWTKAAQILINTYTQYRPQMNDTKLQKYLKLQS